MWGSQWIAGCIGLKLWRKVKDRNTDLAKTEKRMEVRGIDRPVGVRER